MQYDPQNIPEPHGYDTQYRLDPANYDLNYGPWPPQRYEVRHTRDRYPPRQDVQRIDLEVPRQRPGQPPTIYQIYINGQRIF